MFSCYRQDPIFSSFSFYLLELKLRLIYTLRPLQRNSAQCNIAPKNLQYLYFSRLTLPSKVILRGIVNEALTLLLQFCVYLSNGSIYTNLHVEAFAKRYSHEEGVILHLTKLAVYSKNLFTFTSDSCLDKARCYFLIFFFFPVNFLDQNVLINSIGVCNISNMVLHHKRC